MSATLFEIRRIRGWTAVPVNDPALRDSSSFSRGLVNLYTSHDAGGSIERQALFLICGKRIGQRIRSKQSGGRAGNAHCGICIGHGEPDHVLFETHVGVIPCSPEMIAVPDAHDADEILLRLSHC